MKDKFLGGVDNCPRCGGRHGGLTFLPFKRPMVAGVAFTHWTFCPETGEPMLMTRASLVRGGTNSGVEITREE